MTYSRGRKRSPHDDPSAQRGEDEKYGKRDHGDDEQIAGGLAVVRGGHDSAYPDAAVPAGRFPEIENQVLLILGFHRSDRAAFKRYFYCKGYGNLTGQQCFALTVDQRGDTAVGIGKILSDLQAAVLPGHFRHIAAHGLSKGADRGLVYHLAADHQHEDEKESEEHRHQNGDPRGDFQFDGGFLRGFAECR